MLYILYGLLIVYILPLLGIIASIVLSDQFLTNAPFVGVMGAIAISYVSTFRDILGSMIVPLVTAYSVPISGRHSIPSQTKVLFTFLALVFVSSAISYGLVVKHEVRIATYGPIFAAFRDLTLSHAKEALAYIALTIGISVKPAQSVQQPAAAPKVQPASPLPADQSSGSSKQE